jgi:hypothetical protein
MELRYSLGLEYFSEGNRPGSLIRFSALTPERFVRLANPAQEFGEHPGGFRPGLWVRFNDRVRGPHHCKLKVKFLS